MGALPTSALVDVERLFGGSWPHVHRMDLTAGTLMLFNGERSMHRVRRVTGAVARRVAVLSYDTEPGFRSTSAINATLYGPRVVCD